MCKVTPANNMGAQSQPAAITGDTKAAESSAMRPIKASSSRAAFQGAPFDKNGFCLFHSKVQLTQPIKNEQGKLMYQELKRTCPSCQQEKHKSRKGTSLGGGKVREGRVHGYKQTAGEATSSSPRARSVSRGRKPREDKPRKEYDTPFDEKGRCHYHKNVQLATKKLGGGWKVVHAICPKCMEDKYDDDRSVKSGSSRKSSALSKSSSLAKKIEGRSADGQYDKNGCCVLHTHIQVAKKRVFGSGWKVVRVCPACEKGETVGLDDDRMSVCSKSSRKSSRSLGSRSVKSSRSVRSTASRGKAASSSRYGALPFDADGYCCRHPSVQLAQKKMMGGFKIIHDTCPDCAAEGGGGKKKVPRRKSSNGTGRVFDDSGSECSGSVSSSKNNKRRRVKNLKTEDENGKHGRYTGDVDENYRPNGQGVMKYDDGSVYEGVWSEGTQVHGKTKKRS
ncbi:hypothetical protein HJC23_001395 [Cyclotella cryptica]|uniref:Uncharacterized protein n=1 Tax=Cyclotella cryptica TaxID=29204 RepID=A0ABD3P8R7_9STRA|eukprot:CCRYP_016732-RB/>CCRYP_016732-RB protein AED:0.00 eAED:0.00 QI:824/1/1/1/1/1/2/226/448